MLRTKLPAKALAAHNRPLRPIRARIEKIFDTWKRSYRFRLPFDGSWKCECLDTKDRALKPEHAVQSFMGAASHASESA